ncbi:MAG: pyridoxamine 5'-phosphate oxidase family protein [Nitrososphaerota archaeon]|nr:pyridoxamine 5'-phosphate oxidase family protein [Nitrososphaerota archaeon]
MKSYEGQEGIGMSEHDARRFLESSRSTLLLGTLNSDGSPMIHPVWYHFDSATTKLYFYTEPALKKAANIRRNKSVYFDVDSDRWPYKGVKGKGTAKLVVSKAKSYSIASKILRRYVKKDKPLIEFALDKVKKGGYVVFEITPAYFTSWDYGKLVAESEDMRDAIMS